ncbi:MAG: bifunctional proline dehydrogenase/L-glutamate gamma-semialdehyde dehydrogenase PutA [Paracoccaceae bacterium]
MKSLQQIRTDIQKVKIEDEFTSLARLTSETTILDEIHTKATKRAVSLVVSIRTDGSPGLMEAFLAEYGLSTDEGVALMCLAEALLRVPDPYTIDELIEDKIAPSEWGSHLGQSSSSLVNASTWALMLTGKVLQNNNGKGIASILHSTVKRLGEPVIRKAVNRAMREMGHQFVLGRTIDEALSRGGKLRRQGYTFSFDMLGEAAITAHDAAKYFDAYSDAISKLSKHCRSGDVCENPGISVKLSALHPRYEVGQKGRVMRELVPLTRRLARMTRKAGMGFNIDAEEADRLDLSLDVIEAVLRDPDLAGWDGFGVVVQAYSKRADLVLDWLHQLARDLDRKIMVRLVKGAYWDSEIKRAQVEGLGGFPVFTHKAATDVSYLHCAKKLLGMTDRIYPQFATHNAHTVASILEMTDDRRSFEFQRLQGMGEALHRIVLNSEGTRCRIYAPVGTHQDLLAYLVRRLLENGANSSFVNQIVDGDVAPEVVAEDPHRVLEALGNTSNPSVIQPTDIYGPDRQNSSGWDLHDNHDLDVLNAAREPFKGKQWKVFPLISGEVEGKEEHPVWNPAKPEDRVGTVVFASENDAETALALACNWAGTTASYRAGTLRKIANLYEENFGELFAVLTREAGKNQMDAISELREAVDFLRFYAIEGEKHGNKIPCGIFTCISPWNFPLAIFTGQIAAALAAGNGVLAKPSEATSVAASIAVRLMHKAGVPREVLQFLPGLGSETGAKLTSDSRVNGVCFTGSTPTARLISRAMAMSMEPSAPLIAETGGLNAMIVDSSALPEQAIRDIIASAFRSAGQRCSALRMLYLQEDIAEPFLEMLCGAMDEMVVSDPWSLNCDLGPVIDERAKVEIEAHINAAAQDGRLIKRLQIPASGTYIPPSIIRVSGIADLEKEIFGPVLHIATFNAEDIDDIVDAINASGYGLTFGMHSRIDDRVNQVTSRLRTGNVYINRNQIGAVVGSQPFGGEGLSGTGPKAGGPAYLPRFKKVETKTAKGSSKNRATSQAVQAAIDALGKPVSVRLHAETMPGVTGESNLLSTYGRGTVLCLGPTSEAAYQQAKIAKENGCQTLMVAEGVDGDKGVCGHLDRIHLAHLTGFDLVALWSNEDDQRDAKQALASREGAIIPLATGLDLADKCRIERHICIDTTAAGGNTSLLSASQGL